MSTAIIKDFVTNNGLEVEESITLGDKTVTSLVDSSTVNAIVTSPSVASSIVVAGGASTKTYDSADLLPLSGNTSGELAYVNANNRLYLWNGVGWYGIALINTSPTFDSGGSPESSYTLDSSGGTATTITLNATDPEGATIQYSYLSDSASDFVTISQANNVFTLTALSDSALDSNGYAFGGTFNITFRASDGVNIVPAVSNFTLTIIVNYDWSTSSQQGSRFVTTTTTGAPLLGGNVDISRDGNTAIAGAKGDTFNGYKGTASVYTRSGSTWSLEQRLNDTFYSSSNDQFGTSVAISGDGTIAAIGSPFKQKTGATQNTGSFQVWKKESGTWSKKIEHFPPVDPYNSTENDHWFGWSLAIDATGERIAVGVPKKDKTNSPTRSDCGAVWVYKNNGDKFYDIENGVYQAQLAVSSQDGNPMGFEFNNDGTKFYMTGSSTDAVYQYSLSTAYDVTTATYDNVSLDISTQVPYPTCLNWNNDGTKLWVSTPNSHGGASSSLFEYAFTTPYDLSTGSYNNYDIDFTSDVTLAQTETRPMGLTFNSAGTKMFIVGWEGYVHGFDLSTAWDISSFSYNNEVSPHFYSTDTNFQGLEFNNDGTKLFLVGRQTQKIYQYSLSTAYDVSTMTYDGVNIATTNETTPFQMAFNPTGSKMYVTGYTGNAIRQFNTQGLDVQQEAVIYADDFTDDMYLGWDVAITPDGDRIVAGAENRDITGATRGGAVYVFDRSGTTWSQFGDYIKPSDPGLDDDFGTSVDVSSNGNTIVVGSPREDTEDTDAGAAYIFEYGSLPTISSASYDSKTFDFNTQEGAPTGLDFNADGTKMFVIGYASDTVFQYSLSTPYDVSTASYDNVSVSVATQAPVPRGMKFKPDGTRLYIVNYVSDSSDAIYQYNLSSPFDLSTMTYSNNSLSVGSQDTNPRGLTFKPDGTKLFLCGQTSPSSVYAYDLSTAWDISSASYSNTSFNVSSQDSWMNDVTFNSTGERMFTIGNNNDRVYQYSLSSAWDISTASYDSVFHSLTTSSSTEDWNSIVFNPDETKMYVTGNATESVYQYSITTELGFFQVKKLTASDAAASAKYGTAVAIDDQGTVVMVGSPFINSSTGEAYVYQRTGDSWSTATEQKKLTSLTTDTNTGTPQFGNSVSLSRGGGTAVVGAQSVLVGSAGSGGGIYIFTGTRV